MKIEVNLENSSMSEFFSEDECGCVTFTDAFKEAVLKAFVQKINYDSLIRTFIKDAIKEGLWQLVCQYKNESAIKAIVDEVIRDELRTQRTGSLIFTNNYVEQVKKATESSLSVCKRDIDVCIKTTVANEVEKYIKVLYDGNKLREFIDFNKLSSYVIRTMEAQK